MAAYNDADWRTLFPEFSNTTIYPTALTSMLWKVGTDFIADPGYSPISLLGPNQLQYALDLMAAHLLVINRQNQQGEPGSEQGGFVTNATIDKISVTKLAPPAKDQFGWWLNQTTYGQQIAVLLEVAAVGGFAVGGMPERTGFRKVGGVFF